MTNVSVGAGSVANVSAALVSIGFTVDSQDTSKHYWSKDTNGKIYVKVVASSSNTQVVLYNSSNNSLFQMTSLSASNQWKMTCEIIGDSVVLGFRYATDVYNKVGLAIIAPATTNDRWLYACNSTVYMGDTETAQAYGTGALYGASANGVQIAKYYDGTRFTDNLYLTTACCGFEPFGGSSANNYLTATVGTDEYLLIKQTSNQYYNNIAIKRVAA